MGPSHDWRPIKPDSLAGYLAAMSRPILSTGMSWKVVSAKWSGISDAMSGFDPQAVAGMTDDDVERLVSDTRMIRNRKKIEAIIANAQRLLELDNEYGGFDRYLRAHGSFDQTVAALRGDFRFLGPGGAYYFLYGVGEPVPSHDEWSASRERRAS